MMYFLVRCTVVVAALGGCAVPLATPPRPPLPAAAPASTALPTGLAGFWRQIGDPSHVIRFETAKYEDSREGTLRAVAPVLDAAPGSLVVCSGGKRKVLNVRLRGDELTLGVTAASSQAEEVFRRALATPEIFAAEPVHLPAPREIPAARIAEIQEELQRRRALDQKFRKPGEPAPVGEALEEAKRIDTENLAFLKHLIAETGWIDARRFGGDAAKTAFLLVQHSGELPLMLAALREIEIDVKANLLDGEPYALLFDRTQLMLGQPQVYGSQVGKDSEGKLVILQLSDPERVDERRRQGIAGWRDMECRRHLPPPVGCPLCHGIEMNGLGRRAQLEVRPGLEEKLAECIEQRQIGATCVEPKELAHLVHFQEDVTTIGRDDQIEAAKNEAEGRHDLGALALDRWGKLIAFRGHLIESSPPIILPKHRLL